MWKFWMASSIMVDCRRNFFYLYFRVLSDKTETIIIIIIINTRKGKKGETTGTAQHFFKCKRWWCMGGGERCQGWLVGSGVGRLRRLSFNWESLYFLEKGGTRRIFNPPRLQHPSTLSPTNPKVNPAALVLHYFYQLSSIIADISNNPKQSLVS